MELSFPNPTLFTIFAVTTLRTINTYMNYDEYLKCAEKHLKSCQQLLEGIKESTDNKEACIDIWYLSGYIIEGFTVYSAYKINGWNPISKDGVKDIKLKYDKSFSYKTHLDFHYRRVYKGKSVFPPGLITYFVQGHDYKSIIEGLLVKEPVFKDVPIMGSGAIDSDVKILVDNWKPDIRYWYKEEQMKEKKIPILTVDLLKRLIETCNDIYKKMIFV